MNPNDVKVAFYVAEARNAAQDEVGKSEDPTAGSYLLVEECVFCCLANFVFREAITCNLYFLSGHKNIRQHSRAS